MSAKSRAANQAKAVKETEKKIEAVKTKNKNGEWDGVISRLETTLKRQRATLATTEKEVQLEIELGMEL